MLPAEFFQLAPEMVWCKITDIRQETQEWGPTIVVEVAPLGESTPQMIFFRASDPRKPRSKWQRWLKALAKIGVDTSSAAGIIGRYVKFELVEQSASIGGEERDWTFWKAIQLFPDEAAAMEDMLNSQEPAPPASTANGEIPEGILQVARVTWEALGHNEASFRTVALSSWPQIDVEELLQAVQGSEAGVKA